MEGIGDKKLAELELALSGFAKSLDVDGSLFEATVADLIDSGKIQKFEICTELLWKTMKVFMYEKYGVDLASPKPVIKAFYSNGLCNSDELELMIEIIDERNRLSHLYKKSMIIPLLEKLNGYYRIMRKIADCMIQ